MENKPFSPDSPEKTDYQAKIFANRLSKQYKQLRKWARKNRITCYRLYDRDIPEIPLALDIYTFLPDGTKDKYSAILQLNEQNAAISRNGPDVASVLAEEALRTYIHLYLYERPYEKDEKEESEWLTSMAKAAAEVVGISEDHVLVKRRRKIAEDDGKGGRTAQYSKLSRDNRPYVKGLVFEQGQIFYVNLTDYIDTGLFFDHRPLRDTVRGECRQKSVLNLFCYTASFSVYAAEGGASFVESVDTSNTYLDWAKDNMAANGFTDKSKYLFTREDVSAYLDRKIEEKAGGTKLFDIIILDPPTFSNSKRSGATLDVNRDWAALVRKSLSLLTPDGILYFSTNSRRLVFEEQKLPSRMNGEPLYKACDISAKTIPADYRNSKIHRCWKIERITSASF